jgi:hypothetical protein
MDLKETWCADVDWIYLAQWQVLVNAIINPSGFIKDGEFFY